MYHTDDQIICFSAAVWLFLQQRSRVRELCSFEKHLGNVSRNADAAEVGRRRRKHGPESRAGDAAMKKLSGPLYHANKKLRHPRQVNPITLPRLHTPPSHYSRRGRIGGKFSDASAIFAFDANGRIRGRQKAVIEGPSGTGMWLVGLFLRGKRDANRATTKRKSCEQCYPARSRKREYPTSKKLKSRQRQIHMASTFAGGIRQ